MPHPDPTSDSSRHDGAARAALAGLLAATPDLAYVDALLIDLCGIVRGKRFPRAEAERLFISGFQIPYSVYFLDVTGWCADPAGRGVSDGDPDGTAHVVLDTLAPVPWASAPAAQVLATVADGGAPALRVDPRQIASAALDRVLALGYRPCVAFELEFYLLDPERDARGRPRSARLPGRAERETSTQVYGMVELEAAADFVQEVAATATAQNIPASVVTSEYAPAQFEVNLRHVDDAVRAADHCALLRHAVAAVAARQGMRASFMSKPFPDQAGSGMHVHLSLLDAAGRNVFAAGPDDDALPGGDLLRHAVGGILDTHYDAMAIYAPNLNALRRFQPGHYVPVSRTWAVNNRSAAVRIPAGGAASRRFEFRVPGADANPYLVLTAMLAGLHHGISRGLEPGPAGRGNLSTDANPEMPLGMEAALARFENSAVLAPFFGREYQSLYAATKRAELARFADAISPREYDWYL